MGNSSFNYINDDSEIIVQKFAPYLHAYVKANSMASTWVIGSKPAGLNLTHVTCDQPLSVA